MLNPISFLRNIFQRRRVPPARAPQKLAPEHLPADAVGKATEAISPERFREMFVEMLDDPGTRSAIMQGLARYFPVQGGTGCTGITSGKIKFWDGGAIRTVTSA